MNPIYLVLDFGNTEPVFVILFTGMFMTVKVKVVYVMCKKFLLVYVEWSELGLKLIDISVPHPFFTETIALNFWIDESKLFDLFAESTLCVN